ncbi:helix-turn-helix transcriptional regulator [Nitrospirales bacterium NOB]|nr:MAG: helix-turn-helix protein [Nitrospira sp. OLB3]MBV6469346.1 hypothetical protein [Nitrospirota bacterium]MCE7966509.1 XRE family transcriptional regulator [Nitrospira sp. NTP2]MDL1890358.1 helix-turn-helix transcriptional regulator [Nitrospirales bacterium NOB]MEB2340328.1 helix-turn-helix domain-containing protein [Nitrospirales bacterium]QOJ36855.1 MAG: helix-turn-helix domain-containing protein [Nitrospira sp.]
MSHIGPLVRAWRLSQKCSERALAEKTGLSSELIEAIESEEVDPNFSTLQSLAAGLQISLSWLCISPSDLTLLCQDDEEGSPIQALTGADPVLDRIVLAAGYDRSLYVLLTALIQAGDPKLLRAAEVNLRGLVKQSKQATVPWQSRPPGHFEPPSD